VSGQASAAAPAVRPSRTAAPARPLTVPRRPRRVSGPVRRGVKEPPARRRADHERSLAVGLLGACARLPRRRSLGGRPWIALVAFALIGIVTLQLGLLKLNAGIGRALEREAVLQRENAALSIENSELAAGDRVTSQAVRLGMEVIPTGALRFLTARPGTDPSKAATALDKPVRLSTTASGEAAGAGSAVTRSSAAPTEQATTGTPTAPASSESSNTTSTSAEPATAGSPQASGSGEASGRASKEAAAAPRESTSPSSTPSSTAARPSTSAPAEGTPVGGTGAGPSG
jgi:hypothetical protein